MPALRATPLAVVFLLAFGRPVPATEVTDFFPVIAGTGADPWVLRHDGYYYLTATTGTNVTVWRSKSLSSVGGGERKVVWTPPAKGPNSKNLWAPELHRLNGKWYVYYAADDGENDNHRMYVLENEAADPFDGQFVDKGKIADPDADRWAIDGTVLSVKGKDFFVWSGWAGGKNVRQELYIAPMKNPWTLAGPRMEISRPTHDWETVGEPTVNEGPQALVRNGSVHVVYSASGSWTDDYCLGLLTLAKDGDPLDPKAWRKTPKPVFERTKKVFGPGHCSFTTSPDGKEDWLVYHAARHAGAGWARNLRIQPFVWGKAGEPQFGTPAPPDIPIRVPGGETGRVRLEAENATLRGGVKATREVGASGGEGVILPGAGVVEIACPVPAKGTYCLVIRYASDAPKKRSAEVAVSINGNAARSISFDYTAGVWSAVAVRVELGAGENTLVLTAEKPGVVIDCVDLTPDR